VMFRPFQLKKTIGEAYDMDLGDSLNAKKALARLGHLEVPEGGLDEYPDRPMIEAVKSFQRAQGLAVDGVMKPGGPTLERLNQSLVAKQEPAPRPRGSIIADPRRKPEPTVTPINLKRPVTPSTSVDLGDIGRIKSVLEVLGLPLPGGTADPYPTRDLFETIRAFQRREGLVEDGEMKPGGETEARMNEVLNRSTKASRAARVQAEQATGLPTPGQGTDAATPRPGTPDGEALKAGTVTVGGERMDLGGLSEKLAAWDAIVRSGATDEAGASHIDEAPEDLRREVGEALLGILPGTGEALEAKEAYHAFQAAREALRRGDLSDAGINAALALVSTAGAVPVIGKGRAYVKKAVRLLARGIEAATEGRKAGQAAGAAALGTTGALTRDTPREDNKAATAERTDIAPPPLRLPGTPDGEALKAGLIMEDRRGNFATKAEIERIQAWIEKNHPDWEHKGGGVDRKKGGLRSEFWIPSVAKLFGGDGRKGGTFVDLSFKTPSGKWIHIQTVDVDPKTGKVTQDELDAADRIRRSGKNIDVILIPKGVQMAKFFKRSKRP